MRRIRFRPTPATVIASIALLIALGGTSVAAVKLALPANSVGTAQLKTHAVTNSKIADNAVTTAKVANHSLLRIDFKSGQIPAGPPGPPGAQGARGPTGAQGPAGASAARAWAVVKGDGTIVRQSGVTSVSRTSTGRYTVTFASDISNCAWLATLSNLDTGGTLVSGTITTNASTSTTVRVATAFMGSAADEAFAIAALC